MRMTKKQAIQDFNTNILKYMDKEIRRDYIAVKLEWSYYIDNLLNCGLITENQVNNWTTPQFYILKS